MLCILVRLKRTIIEGVLAMPNLSQMIGIFVCVGFISGVLWLALKAFIYLFKKYW